MGNKLYRESDIKAIANAIRGKNRASDTYKVSEMAAAISAISGSETIEWHQCPEPTRNFLSGVTYDPADYTVSSIAAYAPATVAAANYKPIPKAVGGNTLANETPNVATPFGAGTVKPLDPLRWIDAPHAVNVRDLGGWTCDGGTVKYGLLFRGGEVVASDRAVLVENLGIRHDLNLRGHTELNEAGASLTTSPLGTDVYFTAAENYNWYSIDVNDAWRMNLRCVFDAVTHGEPVYFHCAAGADRTGTLACVIEGLLGMSQSDVDKDYELTCFYTGTSTDSTARRRNEDEWKQLITQISAKDGTTFRDKCVTFAAELGFTAEEINAFRAAMIDGTPDTVTPTIDTFTVTKTLSSATVDNMQTAATEYQPYTAVVTPSNDYIISNISIKMGGTDITGQCFTGEKTVLRRSVSLNLTNCTADNTRKAVIDGQSYAAVITAASGYTLDRAAVSIKIGGVEMAQYYSGGTIAIPRVTGNIEIMVTAVAQAPSYTNVIPTSQEVASPEVYNGGLGYKQDTRINSSHVAVAVATTSANRLFTTGLIPVSAGDVIRFKNCWIDPDGTTYPQSPGGCNILCYDSSKSLLSGATWLTFAAASDKFANIESDSDGNVVGFTYNYTSGFIWFTLAGLGENAVITINEPVD